MLLLVLFLNIFISKNEYVWGWSWWWYGVGCVILFSRWCWRFDWIYGRWWVKYGWDEYGNGWWFWGFIFWVVFGDGFFIFIFYELSYYVFNDMIFFMLNVLIEYYF